MQRWCTHIQIMQSFLPFILSFCVYKKGASHFCASMHEFFLEWEQESKELIKWLSKKWGVFLVKLSTKWSHIWLWFLFNLGMQECILFSCSLSREVLVIGFSLFIVTQLQPCFLLLLHTILRSKILAYVWINYLFGINYISILSVIILFMCRKIRPKMTKSIFFKIMLLGFLE